MSVSNKTGLVLEGGGLRGIYTVGVLEVLLENGISPDYLIGASAGACNGASFASNQKGRGYRVIMNYIEDNRYVGFSNFIKTKSIFGADFIFDEIPHKLDLYDYNALLSSPMEFITVATNATTGKPHYFKKSDIQNSSVLFKASSALPVFSPMVEFRGEKYLDGGTSDPIPVKKAEEDGCSKILVVLTQHRDFTKSPERFKSVYSRVYRQYPNMVNVLNERHNVYNSSLEYIRKLETEQKVLVIAPSRPVGIGRFEKDKAKLEQGYMLGVKDTKRMLDKIKAFFNY